MVQEIGRDDVRNRTQRFNFANAFGRRRYRGVQQQLAIRKPHDRHACPDFQPKKPQRTIRHPEIRMKLFH
jgi:hypothetical protein